MKDNCTGKMTTNQLHAELVFPEDNSFDFQFAVVCAAQICYLLTGCIWVWYIAKGGCQNKSTLALTMIWGVLTQSVTVMKKTGCFTDSFSCVDTRLLSCVLNGVFTLMWTLAIMKSNMKKCKLRVKMETYMKISFSIGIFWTISECLLSEKFVTIKSPWFSREMLYTFSCKYKLPDLLLPMSIEYSAIYIPAIITIFIVYRHIKRDNDIVYITKAAFSDKVIYRRFKILECCDNGSHSTRSVVDSNCMCSTCAGIERTILVFFVFFLAYALVMRPAMMVYSLFNDFHVKDDISPNVGVLGCLLIVYRISLNSFTVRRSKSTGGLKKLKRPSIRKIKTGDTYIRS